MEKIEDQDSVPAPSTPQPVAVIKQKKKKCKKEKDLGPPVTVQANRPLETIIMCPVVVKDGRSDIVPLEG